MFLYSRAVGSCFFLCAQNVSFLSASTQPAKEVPKLSSIIVANRLRLPYDIAEDITLLGRQEQVTRIYASLAEKKKQKNPSLGIVHIYIQGCDFKGIFLKSQVYNEKY